MLKDHVDVNALWYVFWVFIFAADVVVMFNFELAWWAYILLGLGALASLITAFVYYKTSSLGSK